MTYVKLGVILCFWLLVGAFLHYTLPQHDIARITDTYQKRVDFGENSLFWASQPVGSAANAANRDVFFLQSVRTNDRVMVYRNEDTGFGWPPYFKLDSADLHAEAANLTSTGADPQWVAITHYGWRSRLLTTYPNAIGIRPVAGPDVTLIPWLNIIILLLLVVVAFMAWRIWERFEDRVIDPLRDRAAVTWAKLRDRASGRR